MQKIDGLKFKEMLTAGANALELNRAIIDELNVFPVPDGDTGTNMSLTIASAVREINVCNSLILDDIAVAFSKGALKGARGNSGVISSQIFKGFSVALHGKADINAKTFSQCLQKAAEIAYQAVTKPKEGTILTVIKGMAEFSVAAAKEKKITFEEFLKNVIDEGKRVLAKTPEMLPILKKAGVVDAGGQGLVTIFDGMYKCLVGEELTLINGETVKFAPEEQVVTSRDADPFENDYDHITFQYCTEYFITHLKKEVTTAAIDKYRDYLTTIGDCVLVISDVDVVKTHVHTNHPDRALKAALNLGELDGLKIENMVEQHRKIAEEQEKLEENKKEYAMISICTGDGMHEIFKGMLVDEIIDGGQTMNPSVDDILSSINKVNAKNVFIFPNNSNIILAANQTKDLAKANVYVVPTTSVPEGISAAMQFNPDATPEENFEAMKEAASNVVSAEVTYAVRSTKMNHFSVKEGDIIGICGKDLVAKDKDVILTAVETIKKIGKDKDMITLYYGNGLTEDVANTVINKAQEIVKDADFACYYGGQPHYYFVIGAE